MMWDGLHCEIEAFPGHTHFHIGVAPFTQLLTSVLKKLHSREVTLCGKNDVPYHEELLLKERIRSFCEQIIFFKRSSHFEKGPN